MSNSRTSEHNVNASFTVEAAFVVPLTLMLIFTVIWVAFLLHDECVADMWTTHVAEEERMAVEYSRVPYSGKLYLSGFAGDDGLDEVEDMARTGADDIDNVLFSSSKRRVETFAAKNEVSAEADIFTLPVYGLLTERFFGKSSLGENVRVYDKIKTARVTTTVYRFFKGD